MTGGTFCWLGLQEARRLLLARWAVGATLLLCASSVLSVALSTRELQEQTLSFQEMQQQRVEAQVRGTARPQGRAAEPGLRVIRPPAPGAVFAAGVEPTLPAAWEFTPAGTEARAPYGRRHVGINGRSVGDLSEIIAGLGGLLALWLGVSTIMSDRTAGRMAALRTLPVASGTMAGVRLAGGLLAVTCVVAAWCLTVGLSVRAFVPAEVAIPSLMPVWMAGPVLCYLALMYAFGTAAGAAAREGPGAFVMTFLVWMAIVLVVPQTNQLITRAVIDVSPQRRMEVERREHMADAVRVLENDVGAAMAAHWPGGPRPTDEDQHAAYVAAGEPVWRAGVARIRDAAALEERQWLDRRARADRFNGWLDGLNPSAWLRESMAELAGTGHSRAAAWAQAIDAHGRTMNEHLFDNRPRVNARVFWKEQSMLMAFDRRPAPQFSDLPLVVEPPTHSGAWSPAYLRRLAGLMAYTAIVMAAAYGLLRSRAR